MAIQSYLLENFTLDYSNFKQGAEAVVFKGTSSHFPSTVAIKKWSKRLHDKDEKRRVGREVALLMQNPHKNVIEFLGILIDNQSEWIGYVMPYMENGSLHEIIHNTYKSYDDIYKEDKINSWIVGICSGLSHLHSKNIIHRDINPSKSYDEVKLSGFGIARSLENLTHSMTAGCGTLVYIAPEIFKGENYDVSADIYSLSITIWEILHRRNPFDHITVKKYKLPEKIISGERPQLNNNLLKELFDLLMRCWHANAPERPTINEVLEICNETKFSLSKNSIGKSPEKKTVLLLGGWENGRGNLDSLLILENYGQNWKELNIKLPYGIRGHGARFLNNNLYIFGGGNEEEGVMNSTYKLSKSLHWEKMADMNKTRYKISNSSVILNHQIWVCGGHSGKRRLKSVEMYDPLRNKWKYMKDMNESRRNAAAAVVNGRILCSGGEYEISVEYYDPWSGIWTLIYDMPQMIHGHGAVEMNGHFIVVGGVSNGGFLKNTWALEIMGKKAKRIARSSMSIPRGFFSIAKIDDKIFVCGDDASVEIFDGEVWRNGPKMQTSREYAPAIVLPMQFVEYLN